MNPLPRLVATYRVQLTPRFGFEQARAALDYIQSLGVSHLYCSPIFETRPGSDHGYDATDPTRIRDELGGEAAFRSLAADARARGMGLLLDIVPNHMAADHRNPWWWDVLKRGRESPFAEYFDIDWSAADDKVVLPVLGRPLADAIAAGELHIARDDGAEPALAFHDRRFPLAGAEHSDPADVAAILHRQHYRLVHWREEGALLNYRRFFDITDLVALRTEREDVFKSVHDLTLRLVADDLVTAVRVDHVDGLADPGAYLGRLALRLASMRSSVTIAEAAPPIFVEKILADDEDLPGDWPVRGATGYEFLAHLNPVFVDVHGFKSLEADARRRFDLPPAFSDTEHDSKRLVIDRLFQPELTRLALALRDALAASGDAPPPDPRDLRAVIADVTVHLGVYRTYAGVEPPGGADRARIETALACAEREAGEGDPARAQALAALRRVLLRIGPFALGALGASAAASFTQRWQQFTGPSMAKGVEDTALYRHIVLASLNEVGAGPTMPGDPAAAFHAFCQRRARHWPGALSATATHDTKRGEDTRLRIDAISEFAPQWLESLDRWTSWHASLRRDLPTGPAPSQRDESLFYQSLLGVWPVEDGHAPPESVADRLAAYMVKAARKAKLRTSWHEQNEEYEAALQSFVHEVARGEGGARFREDCRGLRRAVALHGAIRSLSQVVAKSLAPGAPDFYHGAETWDLSLVDPDNRRPVDVDALRSLLDQTLSQRDRDPEAALADMLDHWPDGRIKLYLTHRCLALRAAHADVFDSEDYLPLAVTGSRAGDLLAFARRAGGVWIVAILPRLTRAAAAAAAADAMPIGERAWGDTIVELPDGAPAHWTDRLADTPLDASGVLPVSQALRRLPVAALVGEAKPAPQPRSVASR